MDLNLLYSQHQISLIRADEAHDRAARGAHLAAARHVAARIHAFQRTTGAGASHAWGLGKTVCMAVAPQMSGALT